MTFESLLAPHSGQEFLGQLLGRSALYVPGEKQKFAGLYSWHDLNRLLEFGGLAFPRLRLFSRGQEVPEQMFVRKGISGYPRLIVEAIDSALCEEGMLAVESIHELHKPLAQLCNIVEQSVEIQVQADVYASWPESSEPKMLWNEHDSFVLQVEGGTRWWIYPPTAVYPTAQNPPPEPHDNAAWEGVLSQGDLLYIPKGWWYRQRSCEPAIFAAVKFKNPTAADILHNVIGRQLNLQEECPRFGDLAGQANFIALIQREITAASEASGLILNFLRDVRDSADTIVAFNLPHSVTTAVARPTDELSVIPLLRFLRPDSIKYLPETKEIGLVVNGNLLRFHQDAAMVVTYLCRHPRPTVGSLRSSLAAQIGEQNMLQVLCDLVRHGVVALSQNE